MVLDLVHLHVLSIGGTVRERERERERERGREGETFTLHYVILSRYNEHVHVVWSMNVRNEHVVGDVVQVSAILEPGSGHADVVRGALAVDLDQDGDILNVLPVPLVEWSQQLQTIAGGKEGPLSLK